MTSNWSSVSAKLIVSLMAVHFMFVLHCPVGAIVFTTIVGETLCTDTGLSQVEFGEKCGFYQT